MIPQKPHKYRPYNKHHSYALEINDADENDEGEYSIVVKGKKSSATLSVEVNNPHTILYLKRVSKTK